MIIELLYPEICSQYGDSANITYLEKALPDATFIRTSLNDEPYFVSGTPDLLYMGLATEAGQHLALTRLMPYRDRLAELLSEHVPMLFTGNAGEILFEKITLWNDVEIECLGLLPFTAKRAQFSRYNGLVLGTYGDLPKIVGFQSSFDFWYGDNENCAFLKVERGIGLNRDSHLEGIAKDNLWVTSLLGPLLILNPHFTRHLLQVLGVEDPALPFEKDLTAAYATRVREFEDPQKKVSDI